MSVLPKHKDGRYYRFFCILLITVFLLLTNGRGMVQLSTYEPQPQLLEQPKQEQPLDPQELQEQQQRHSQQAGGRRPNKHTIHLESISMRKNSSNLSAVAVDDNENDNEKKGTKEDVNNEPDSTVASCQWITQQIATANGSRLELNRIRRLAYVWSRQQQFNNNNNHHQKTQESWAHQQPAQEQEQQHSYYYYSTMDCFERYFDVFRNAFLLVFQQRQNHPHQKQEQEEQLQTQLRETPQQKHAPDRHHDHHRHHWHTVLHIPKTGGSSLCTFIKQETNLTVARDGNNCWSMTYGPSWCCFSERLPMHAQSLSCLEQRQEHDQQQQHKQQRYNNKKKITGPIELQMNENWLDEYCPDDQVYSILLREPVARATSNWHHLLKFPRSSRSGAFRWRQSLVKSNYITWSLSVHRFGSSIIRKGSTTATRETTSTTKPNEVEKKNQTQHAQHQQPPPPPPQQQTLPPSSFHRPYLFRPSNATHLEEARHRLSQMDFLLDLQYMNSSCIQWVLQFMGISQQHAMMTTMTQNTTTTASRGDHRPFLVLPHTNRAKDSMYTSLYNASEFVQGNELDRLLYQSAQQWMDADCVFFQRLLSS